MGIVVVSHRILITMKTVKLSDEEVNINVFHDILRESLVVTMERENVIPESVCENMPTMTCY